MMTPEQTLGLCGKIRDSICKSTARESKYMSDHIAKTRSNLVERRDELAPLVEEHAELEALIAAIGDAPKPAAKRGRPKAATVVKAKTPKEPKAAKPKAEGASRGRKKGSGKRGQQALEIIIGQPGITIPEMAAKMDIKQNYLYRVLPTLEQDGKITKEGKGWHAVGAQSAPETPKAEAPKVEEPKVETHASTEEAPVETAEETEARQALEADAERAFADQVPESPQAETTVAA